MEQLQNNNLFYDPFADETETYQPEELFQEIVLRYQNNEIEHDYTADNFVKDTEALMLDAQFTEQFNAFESIAARMHQLCADDHSLAAAVEQSGLFGQLQKNDNHHSHQHEESQHKTKKKKTKGGNYGGRELSQKSRISFDNIIKMLIQTKALSKKP